MSKPIVLSEQAQQFIEACHAGGTHRFTQELSQYPKSYWSRVDEPFRLPPNFKGAQIFFGVNPASVRVTDEDRKKEKMQGKPDSFIEQWVASKDRTIECVNFLYRDYDGKNFTRPTDAEVEVQYQILRQDPAHAKTPDAGLRRQAHGIAEEVKFKTAPDHYRAIALAHVVKLDPQPSVAQASGGGYNCFWRLDKTFFIRNAQDLAYIKDVQKRWVHMDPAADQGVNDIRHIFRPAGTTNYKELYAPNYPTVAFIKCDLSLTYELDELVRLLPVAPVVLPHVGKPSLSHNQAKTNGVPYQGKSVIAAFNAAHSIVDLALAYGYTKHYGDKWNRPGTKNHCVTMYEKDNRMISRSHSDPASKGEKAIDCFNLFCAWEHNGDARAAVKAAAAELGIEKKSPAPPPLFSARLAAIREWVVTADFSQIIPKHLQSAKGYRTHLTDLRAFMAVLDVFERYGKFSGPISKSQGSSASGLSDNGFHNAMKRLAQSPLLDCIAPEEAQQDGSYWYSLTVAYFDGVVEVNKAIATPSKYATVFNKEKTEDAWQNGGSKRQRAIATIKSCGPGALLMVSTLREGEQTHQAVAGQHIHKSKSSVSRLAKKLEDLTVVSLQRIGRQQYITLLPGWQERVAAQVHLMPTYGNKNRRETSIRTREIDRIDYLLTRKMGNADRLLAKREQAMVALKAIMAQDMVGMDMDEQAEKMRRVLRMDSLKRNATAEHRTVKNLELVMHQNNKAKAYLNMTTPSEERRTKAIMQDYYDNVDLLDARAQLEQGVGL
jgi:hypothetical protein